MNKIIDVRIDMHTDPSVFCLFDSIETDHLIFDLAQLDCSHDFKLKSVLCQNTNLSGGNLLAIENDLAVWYYYSAINQNCLFNSSHTKPLKVRYGNEVLETVFEGLWCSSAEAINHWFPKTMVMEVRATETRDEFESSLGHPLRRRCCHCNKPVKDARLARGVGAGAYRIRRRRAAAT